MIQDVEGALDASARLGEIELAQVWEPPAHLAERAGNERVLDDAAHVVVDVQAERVGLGVRLGELDQDTHAVVEDVAAHRQGRDRTSPAEILDPRRLRRAACAQPLDRRPRLGRARIRADSGQRAQRH